MEQEKTLEQLVAVAFDFSEYTEKEKEEVIGDISEMIMKGTLLRALDEAGESSREKFNALLETEPSAEEMSLFIKENLPNFQALAIEEIKIFQDAEEYLESDEKESEDKKEPVE